VVKTAYDAADLVSNMPLTYCDPLNSMIDKLDAGRQHVAARLDEVKVPIDGWSAKVYAFRDTTVPDLIKLLVSPLIHPPEF